MYSAVSQNCNIDYIWEIRNQTGCNYDFNAKFTDGLGNWVNFQIQTVLANDIWYKMVPGGYFLDNLRVYDADPGNCSGTCKDANVNLITTIDTVGDCIPNGSNEDNVEVIDCTYSVIYP
jgi:hypothetical protein